MFWIVYIEWSVFGECCFYVRVCERDGVIYSKGVCVDVLSDFGDVY